MADTLNQLEFPGIQLRAEKTTFNFQFADNEHSPKGINCSSCKYALQYKQNQKSPHTNRCYETLLSSISPPPYTLDAPPLTSLKRKSSTHSSDHLSKHPKSNNQIYYIESDARNDSNYSPINVKVEATTAISKSISNMQLHPSKIQQQSTISQPNTTPSLDSITTQINNLTHNILTTSPSTHFITTPHKPLTSINKTLDIRCSSCHTILSKESEHYKPMFTSSNIH